jgi:putative holliday junction resolvase
MTNFIKHNHKTVLCIDYGTKNIGFSLYKIGMDPFPMPFYQIKNLSEEGTRKEILQLLDDECVDLIVLGLPLHKDGNDSEMTRIVRRFCDQMKKSIDLPIFFQNEFLTSYEAEDRMKNSARYNFKIDKSQVDSLAASIILEEWLKS